MKKYINTIWAFALTAVFVANLFVGSANAQVFSQSPVLMKSPLPQLESPEAIAKYLWRNFNFENDQTNFGTEEYWQSPEEFLSNKKGDCEDFALMAQELLKQIGKKAFVLNIYGKRYAHTICVYIENGRFNAIDGSDLKRYEAESLKELMGKIYTHWESGAIVTASSTSKKGIILKKISR